MAAARSVLTFDGNDDLVLVGKHAAHRIARDITLEAWVYAVQSGPRWAGIVSRVFDTGYSKSGYGILLAGDGGVLSALVVVASSIQYQTTGASTLPLNTWHHLACTYDGQQMVAYIDGEKKLTYAIAAPAILYQPDHDLYIGTYRDDNEQYFFRGKIAEVRIWSVARTQADIKRDMPVGLRGDEPNLVSYWPMDEGAGATLVKDKAATATHGTIQGATWEQVEVPFEPLPPPPPPAPPPAPPPPRVVDTSAVLAAALERLDRESLFILLQQIVQQIDAYRLSSEGKASDELTRLRNDLQAQVDALKQDADQRSARIEDTQKNLAAMQKQLAELLAGFDARVGQATQGTLDAMRQNIAAQVSSSLDSKVTGIVKQSVDAVDLPAIQSKIDELKTAIAQLTKAADGLSDKEIAEIKKQVAGLLYTTDLSGVVERIRIDIGGEIFRLDDLLRILAGGDKVKAVHFVYDTADITGARLVLLDGTEVTFACTRSDYPDTSEMAYTFKTPDWKGLAASFALRFRKRARDMQVYSRTFMLGSYDAISQSNIVFHLGAT